MPNSLFSRGGFPRSGQWVFVERGGAKHLGICIRPNPDPAWFEVLDDVVTAVRPPDDVKLTGLQPMQAIPNARDGSELCFCAIVHESGPNEGENKGLVLVDVARLAPVTKREQIPAKRLATTSPTWTPAP